MNRIIIGLMICAAGITASCESFFIEDDMENTRINNFELLWNELDKKYSFFEYRNINWDSIYMVYSPQVTSNLNDYEFFSLLSAMLNELRDGHVNLYSDFENSINYEWYEDYPVNFNFNIIQSRYLGKNFKTTGPFISGIIDSTGYVYYGSLADEFHGSDIDIIIEQFSGLKGMIIDLRNNTGGLSRNVKLLAGRFTDSLRLVSYTLYKNGPGHGDFTPPQPNYVIPHGERQFLKPVVLLTNRRTYSATNDLVNTMSLFPHVTVIGGRTGGGGGTPYDYELLNGWRCRFSRTQTMTINGDNIEDGIDPDILINITRHDEGRGADTILEAAINHIKLLHQANL